MSMAIWWRIIAASVGALALSLLAMFGLPFAAYEDIRPFDPVWSRLIVVALIVAGIGTWLFLTLRKRLRAEKALADAMAAEAEANSDVKALSEAMNDALSTLKKSGRGRASALYDLPWYMMIGPPGSGKTTALINSGLKFPLAHDGAPQAVAGVGGTRYCDWWFAEDAVLIDTAGRYTTQDSDAKVDRASWLSFLDLLKTHRTKQPINGVLIAISIEDLLAGTPEEITAHATAIRKRLLELHEHLKIDFPVYAVFTKADLIAGFNEFFMGLNELERRMVWGHTFQTNDKTKNMIGEIPREYDALIERLNEQLTDKMHNEPNPASRVVLFSLPSQVATLKKPIMDFLNAIFEPTRYHANATLRGFYFTSGTQHGTPIDQLVGKLAKNFGAEDVGAQAYSGLGKSYFLTDLLQKVVFGESGWVSTDRGAIRRMTIIRAAAFGSIALVSSILAVLWWTSYSRNSALVAQSSQALVEYRTEAAAVLQQATVADRDFAKVLPHLQRMRNLPAGYATRHEVTPVAATMGLSQRPRLLSAGETAYQLALERMFRPRIIFRLEEQLEANINNPGFVYEALKVYLMVGEKARIDRDLVIAWMRRDWSENLFPGAANAKGRELLEEHLVAMLSLSTGSSSLVTLNQAVVENAQRTLARMSVAERAYELLKSQARGQSQRDWVAAFHGGPDMKLVFEGASGQDLESIRVPFFFTYDGFQAAFIDRLGDIGEQIENERWVLGEAGQQAAIASQYQTLYRDLLSHYTRDFLAAWQDALRKLKLRTLTADKPRYVALSAISSPTSPFKQLLESVRDETQLTKERPSGKRDPVKEAANKALTESSAKDFAQRTDRTRELADAIGGPVSNISSSLNRISRIAKALPLGKGAEDAAAAGLTEIPGANIENQFKQFHVLVEGEGGKRPVDDVLRNLAEINQNLQIAATTPQQAQGANAQLVQLLAGLRANTPRFPDPFKAMLDGAVRDFSNDAKDATLSILRQALAQEVTPVCNEIATNRYPLVRGSARDIPFSDFARLFAAGQTIDKFRQDKLDAYIDKSKPTWEWKKDNPVGQSLSPTALREFQRANDIKDAFFAAGMLPSFQMVVTPGALSGDLSSAKLEINGITVVSQQGVNAPVSITWPGGGGAVRLYVSIGAPPVAPGGGGGLFAPAAPPIVPVESKIYDREGPWAFFRFLDAVSMLRQGDKVVVNVPVSGRALAYSISVGSLKNPLVLPALREFKCPAQL